MATKLTEERRSQLDAIVQKMVSAKEPDSNIRFVVDDFKKKYENEQQEAAPVAEAPKKGLFEALVKDPIESIVVKPGVRLGQAIAGAGIKMFGTDEMKARLPGAVEKGTTVPSALGGFNVEGVKSGVSGYKQVAGEAIEAGANIASAAVPAIKGASATARIAKTAAVTGALGAATGASEGFKSDKSPKEILKQAAVSGTVGAVLGGAFRAAGEAVSAITKKLPSQVMNTTVKTPLDDTRKAITYNGKTLGDEMVARGIRGSDRSILGKSVAELNKNEQTLQELLSNSSATVKRGDLVAYVDPVVAKLRATPGLKADADAVAAILKEVPEEFSVAQANVFKRNLYDALDDVAFKIDPNLSVKKMAMKALAKGLKDQIEKQTAQEIGEGVIKNINLELSVYGRLKNQIVDKIARVNKNNLLGLTDVGVGVAGAVAGGAPGVAATLAGKKILSSTAVRTNIAVGLDKLGKVIDKLPTDSSGKIGRSALMSALRSLYQS